MYKDASGKWENLRLVLQTSERSRENQPVVVALELRPIVMPFRVPVFLSQAFVAYQLLPVHHCFYRYMAAKLRKVESKTKEFILFFAETE
jgi:hypothetical protein